MKTRLTTKILTYSEMIKMESFIDRFRYLKLDGRVAEETFGFDRYLNQRFYTSKEWRDLRNLVIDRDRGCDLGVQGCEIYGTILIHHMNPVNEKDILNRTELLFNPEYLVCVSRNTHNALHYGDESLIKDRYSIVERCTNDTIPWKK